MKSPTFITKYTRHLTPDQEKPPSNSAATAAPIFRGQRGYSKQNKKKKEKRKKNAPSA